MAKSKQKKIKMSELKIIFKNCYSKEEIIDFALSAKYFVALLFEELGEEAFCKIFLKMETNPKPTVKTFMKIWVMLCDRKKGALFLRDA